MDHFLFTLKRVASKTMMLLVRFVCKRCDFKYYQVHARKAFLNFKQPALCQPLELIKKKKQLSLERRGQAPKHLALTLGRKAEGTMTVTQHASLGENILENSPGNVT